MQIYPIYPVGFAANTYLVTADGVNALAVDPAQPRVLEEAARRGLCVRFVLLTHGHFDHIGGVAALQSAGARVGILRGEEGLALYHNLAAEFGGDVPPFVIDFTLTDGEERTLCGLTVRAIATAGHTGHSASYLIAPAAECGEGGPVLFTGDTLFRGSVGRCDLPTGSEEELQKSLKKLFALGNLPVLAGHGEETTLSYEKTHNRYVLW